MRREILARSRALGLEAARLFASVRQWTNLVTVLLILVKEGAREDLGLMAQALWLAMRMPGVPAAHVLALTKKLVHTLTLDADLSPLLASTAVLLIRERGPLDPKHEELAEEARRLLESCGTERGLQGEEWNEMLRLGGLTVPERLLPATLEGLERLVGEGWLFPHRSEQN